MKINKGTKPRAPKGIVYGPPGIGKTTFGAAGGDGLILDVENGCAMVDCHHSDHLLTWQEIMDALCWVATEQHDFSAVAVDTLDLTIRRIQEHVQGEKIESTISKAHGGWGAGKQVMANYMYMRLLPILDAIVDKGIAVLLLAHVRRQVLTSPDGSEIEKATPDIHEDFLPIFTEWSDFVALAHKNREGERVLIMEENSFALAKNRYGISGLLPFAFGSFVNAIGGK